MKKIKLRVWDTVYETHYDVLIIDFEKREIVGEWNGKRFYVPMEQAILQQFTGEYDAAGKEIYEEWIV